MDLLEYLDRIALPSGLGSSFLESTVQHQHQLTSIGRRRTVQDLDCDSVTDNEDVIEATCGGHRYRLLNQLYPTLMESANRDVNMVSAVDKMNRTMVGDPTDMGAAEGQRQIFHLQRNYLYGPNGTCANPKPRSIAQMSNELTNQLFEMHNRTEAVFDTMWTNVEMIHKHVSEGMGNVTDNFVNTTLDYFDDINREINYMHQDGFKLNSALKADGNDKLFNATIKFNQGFKRMLSQMNRTQTMGDQAMGQIDSSMGKMMDFFENLSDQFSGIDDTVGTIIDNLADQVSPLIGFNPLKMGQQTWSLFAKRANNTVTDFQSATMNSIDGTFGTVSTVGNAAANHLGTLADHIFESIDNTTGTIVKKQNDLDEKFSSKLDTATQSVDKLVSDAQGASADAKGLVIQLNLSVGDRKKALQAITSSLDGVAGEGAATIRKQIAALLSSGGQISDSQLSSIVNSLSNMNSNIVGAVADAKAKKEAAAAASRNRLGQSASDKASQTGDLSASIAAQKGFINQYLGLSDEQLKNSVSNKIDALRNVAAKSASGLTDLASLFSSSLSDSSASSDSAISDSNTQLQNLVNLQMIQGAETFSTLSSLVAGNASAVNSQAARSDSDMKSTESQLASILESAGLVMSKTSGGDQSVNIGSLVSSIAKSDDKIGSSFAQQLQDILKSAGADTGKQEDSLANTLSRKASNAASSVDGILSSAKTVNSQSESILDDSQSFNSGTQDQLGSLDAGLAGALAVGVENMNMTQSKLSGDLSRSASDGSAGLDSVGIDQRKNELQIKSDTQQKASEEIVSILGKFKAFMDTILKNARISPGTEFNPKVRALELDFNSSLDGYRNQIFDPKKLVADFESASDDDELLSVDFRTMQARIGANISSLVDRVNSTVGQLPGPFLANLAEVLANVMKEEYAAVGSNISMRTNGLLGAVVGADSDAAGNSLTFLSKLNSISGDWDSRIGASAHSADSSRQDQLSTLLDLTNKASGIASGISDADSSAKNGQRTFATNSRTSEGDITNMVQSIMSSVQSTNSTLTRTSASNSAQAEFNSQMGSSKATRLFQGMQRGVEETSGTVDDTENALLSTTGESAMDVDALDKSIGSYSQERAAKISRAVSQLGGMDSDVAQNISSNKAAVEMNLLMAKRAVRDLVDSWSGYADYEISKFRKMQNVDETYIGATQNYLNSKTSQSSHELLQSQSDMSLTDADAMNAVADYIDFNKTLGTEMDMLFKIVPMLNSTADKSVDQISESAISFDKADSDVDAKERKSSLDAIAQFEQGLDQHAQMALASTRR